MDPLSFTAFLVVHGYRYPVAELSEAGVTLPPEVLAEGVFSSTVWEAGTEAAIELYEKGTLTTYPVHLRLAPSHGAVAELAFTDMAPELRLRLRQAVAEELSQRCDQAQERAAAASRRLMLSGSAPVLALTEVRRRSWLPARVLSPLVATTALDLRVQAGRSVVASAAVLVGLALLAWLVFG